VYKRQALTATAKNPDEGKNVISMPPQITINEVEARKFAGHGAAEFTGKFTMPPAHRRSRTKSNPAQMKLNFEI
jgi:hypothetical protein